MNLLLILSALLSALTGAITGVRAPEVQVHQTAQATIAAAQAPAVRIATIAVPRALPSLVAVATQHAAPAFALAALVPLYADRLRE
jgi:hypothetical protein